MIRAIIVDDEKPTLMRLKRQVADSGIAEVAGVFTKSSEALEFLQQNTVDVALLDIEMAGMNGMELALRITERRPYVSIIFVTAYNQYAVEAFRINAVDYLLKPVTAELLLESLQRAEREIKPRISGEKLTVKCFGMLTAGSLNEKIHFRTEKTKELLAFLIAHDGQFVGRDTILDCLWDGFDGDRALINFNTTLYNLRKALAPFDKSVRILFEGGCYRITTENIDCDYLSFCKIANKKNPCATVAETDAALLMYTGEYLAGIDSLWATQKRYRAADLYVGLVLRLVNLYAGGDKQAVYRYLYAALDLLPLNQDFNFYLIKYLLADNQREQAQKYFLAYKSGLLRQFNETPGAEFKKLF